MNKNISLVCLIICFSFWACKKETRYSTWQVNNETFSYNDIEIAIGKARCGLASRDMNNRFSLGFEIGYGLPTSGAFELNTFTPGLQLCGINFYYHGKFYYHTPSKLGVLYASSVDGKASYTLPPSWFVNYDNPNCDSLLIQGTFNEP